ncbi:MAG: M23 family metallopeptidase [Clostridia bacterium]|nr:M23 family metallopeptidase [Clostridia bacterium]
MNQNQKRRLSRRLIVLVVLIIVATLVVTAVAVSSAKKKSDKKTDIKSTTNATQSTTAKTELTKSVVPISTTADDTPTAVKLVWASPLAGGVTKAYSADIPVFSDTMEDYRVHTGVDIDGEAGTPVQAAADGTVEKVYFDVLMGQTVVISHAGGYKSVYQNLQTATPAGITVGATVKCGDTVGAVGDTALVEISQGPHLHFCVTLDGDNIDPSSLIALTAQVSAPVYED